MEIDLSNDEERDGGESLPHESQTNNIDCFSSPLSHTDNSELQLDNHSSESEEEDHHHEGLTHASSGSMLRSISPRLKNFQIFSPKNMSESRREAFHPRLVERNLPNHQSKQKLNLVNYHTSRFFGVSWMLFHNWFHIMLTWPTFISIFALISVWTICILIFAGIYSAIDRGNPDVDCGLSGERIGETNTNLEKDPIGFGAAFAFSLETCTTVGYGLPGGTNAFFNDCSGIQSAIYFQMLWSMLFNAFLLAFFFSRLARSEQRGVQVLFSDKAIIEKRDGKWVFHVRIYDVSSFLPVVEAHVRMYCCSWKDYERQPGDEIQPQLLHTMRIIQPDDDLGAVLFTSIPNTVTHHIDAYSPLLSENLKKRINVVHNHGLILREVDSYIAAREGIPCPVCGESYGTFDNLNRHIKYSRLLESQNGNFPLEGSHCDPNLVLPETIEELTLTSIDIRNNLADTEILVVVEGIEPMCSGTFQALQSYRVCDIVFGGRFKPCVSTKKGKVFVDLDKFHEIQPASAASMRNYVKKFD